MGSAAPESLRVGVIGYGFAAKVFHIPFIQSTPFLKLQAIVQRSPTKVSSAPADHPEVKHYTAVDDLIHDESCDVVVITTPPDSHFALAKLCLQAGKHILVEKPFVPSVSEAEELIQLAKKAKRLICIYQNRRWDSDFLTVQQLLQDGVFGRIHEVDTHFDYYRPTSADSWRGQLDTIHGGAALFDLGSHLIDQMYALFGLPRAVYGVLSNQKEGRLDPLNPDSVHAQLNYDGGMVVNIRVSDMSVESPQRRFWIRGTKSSFRKNGRDPQEGQLELGQTPKDPGFGVEPAENEGRLVYVVNASRMEERPYPTVAPETYGALYQGFAAAIRSGTEEKIPVSASQAKDVLRIIEALYQSAVEDQVVRL
ncbi:hypothetical protein CkaCkLH20_09530 [Colletotrichum karsti]|uniref:Oxidoreductase n=1 Tax=Colletotrichum karsti TaxID=1095194 RepID=A0A9P6HZI4_9PEZI|nr:uncharacterized protein CkaCkLH20_09530 [Colletotrichum karsti]KAF9873020.1 hypothetical protein CkaCkLH20_09530 [Colletotrichum karsti]